jgi:hypothetical protein
MVWLMPPRCLSYLYMTPQHLSYLYMTPQHLSYLYVTPQHLSYLFVTPQHLSYLFVTPQHLPYLLLSVQRHSDIPGNVGTPPPLPSRPISLGGRTPGRGPHMGTLPHLLR